MAIGYAGHWSHNASNSVHEKTRLTLQPLRKLNNSSAVSGKKWLEGGDSEAPSARDGFHIASNIEDIDTGSSTSTVKADIQHSTTQLKLVDVRKGVVEQKVRLSDTASIGSNVKLTSNSSSKPTLLTSDVISKANYDSDYESRRVYFTPIPLDKEVFICDQNHWRTDICTLRGDIRIRGESSVIWLYAEQEDTPRGEARLKPYPRKWESDGCMKGVQQILLKSIDKPADAALGPGLDADELDSGFGWAEKERQSQHRNLLAHDDARQRQVGGDTSEALGGAGQGKIMRRSAGETGRGEVRDGESMQGGPEVHQEQRVQEDTHLDADEVLTEGDTSAGDDPAEAEGGSAADSELTSHTDSSSKELTRVKTKKKAKLVNWRGFMVDGRVTKWVKRWKAKEMHVDMPPGHDKVDPPKKCDVVHNVTGVVFSLDGYTGNIYHEFNDGLIPLFITIQHLRGEVVLLPVNAKDWWFVKYWDVLNELSKYAPVFLGEDPRVHCFPEVIAGLKIHDELLVDPMLMPNNETMVDFQVRGQGALATLSAPVQRSVAECCSEALLSRLGSWPYRRGVSLRDCERPLLTIIGREDSRVLSNERMVARIADGLGFAVHLVKPHAFSPVQELWPVLQASSVVLGVHGAAMTHLLFMKPGTVLIQVVPLGTSWAAKTYYGNPAVSLGLQYLEYKIAPSESSLRHQYTADDPVLTDPDSVAASRGWENFVKPVYLGGQNVTLSKEGIVRILRQARALVSANGPRDKGGKEEA
eukprot:jgi/Mesen1/7997/ME000425S07194